MKPSNIIVRCRRADKWARGLFLLVSLVFHVVIVYYSYTARFDISVVKTEKILIVRPVSPEPMVFPSLRKQRPAKPDIIAQLGGAAPYSIPPPPTEEERPPGDTAPSSIPPPEPGKVDTHSPGETGPPKEKLIAPFEPAKYTKMETVAEILRRMEQEEAVEKSRYGSGGSADDTLVNVSEEEKKLVVEGKGKGYFAADGYDISPWAKKVTGAINEQWLVAERHKGTGPLSVGVMAVFDKNGKLVSAEIKRTSKKVKLDEAALAAVTAGAPFPPLPNAFPGKELKAYFLFSLN